MSWTEPLYSKGEVDRAGARYVDVATDPEERELALAVINNWRSSHAFPLNTLQMGLRGKVAAVDRNGLVAQRIKRLPSIRNKLVRLSSMKLSRMQDIGGCRAVLLDIPAVLDVDAAFARTRMKHQLLRHDDYITQPAASGYRSIHRAYRYVSDRTTTYNGLVIEIQLRTRLQHQWATAVETVGTFTRQALKSSQGEADWLRFFALMSSVIANREGTPTAPGTPSDPVDLHSEVLALAQRLDVIGRLTTYGAALRYLESQVPTDRYWILELDTARSTLQVRGYRDAIVAADAYNAIERASEAAPERDVVLVSVNTVTGLQRAYPNYYLDASAFTSIVQEVIGL
jgi:hypothetical protein